jgi:hypothetical protein
VDGFPEVGFLLHDPLGFEESFFFGFGFLEVTVHGFAVDLVSEGVKDVIVVFGEPGELVAHLFLHEVTEAGGEEE